MTPPTQSDARWEPPEWLICACGCGEPVGMTPPALVALRLDENLAVRLYIAHEVPGPGWRVEDRGFTSPCWIWTGSRGPEGHARVMAGSRAPTSPGRKHRAAYHVTWEQEHPPVAPPLQLDHLCCNPPCVNPDHLEPVTPAENSRRSRCTKLTLDDLAAIRQSLEPSATVAAQFGVSAGYVGRLRGGRVTAGEREALERGGDGG